MLLLERGNDYLRAVPSGSLIHGPDARSTYLQMRAQPRWRHRTLIMLDPERAIVSFDVEFLLRLMLDLACRSRNLKGFSEAAKVLADSARAATGDGKTLTFDAAAEAAALGVPLAAALKRVPGLEPEFPEARVPEDVWQAWRASLPQQAQLSTLVATATEPRVVAARDAAAECGHGADGAANGADGNGAWGSSLAALDEERMRDALAEVKVRALVRPSACMCMHGLGTCCHWRASVHNSAAFAPRLVCP